MTKIKVIILIITVFGNLNVFSKNTGGKPVINHLDSVIFDLSRASLMATYIDIPVCIKSDDAVFSFDFALKFNLTKMSYATMIELLPSDPTFVSAAYFNSSDLFLRSTNSSQQP